MRILSLILAFTTYAATTMAAAEDAPSDWRYEWRNTDFSQSSVPFDEILSGGPPKDGIPALSDPEFHPVGEEPTLTAREPVIALRLDNSDGAARAYPVRYLIWHEIVNDEIDGAPVAVTYCPLCNSSVVFDRRLNGEVYDFGVSGKLRHSDMIMYDRQTESWWQQFTGEAIIGEMLGARLTIIPSLLQSWGAFREANPDGLVMAKPPGWRRSYGVNPYVGYDSSGWPFLYRGERPPHGIEPLARVVRIDDRVWTLNRLAAAREIVEGGLRLTWREGQASALDERMLGKGREVGDIEVVDAETGAPVAHEITFAFAFHAFHPDGTWMLDR